jgi:serine/threonine protein kinase/tetratricopeptide (TPR) repeat protein
MTQPTILRGMTGSVDPALAELVEELTARLHAGEAVNVEACARDHPEQAESLQRLLPALQMMAELSRSRPEGVALAMGPDPWRDAERGTLGDFRIVREVGRGGMGVVYEAVQISLARRVALKVLPFAAALDPRQLQRFKNEAQAAANLHHTNIVPVYGVGMERSVHYYAMQFIDGHTLAAMIHELRQLAGLDAPPTVGSAGAAEPLAYDLTTGTWAQAQGEHADPQPNGPYTPAPASGTVPHPATPLTSGQGTRGQAFFRTAANLGVQAAEALEHAHQLGVVHRDIKPANLLVAPFSPLSPWGRGAGGEGLRLWVTDFGLAHCQTQAGLTMTGDLVGTLRYMSPEQVLAKRVLVDHRTDVYSLGVTLYELLTLEPAFGGNNRPELLRQIAFDEPRPPRQRDRAIPAELETIVLKAMEKNPAERYATAREVADDLERFLQDKPIQARRPTMVQKVRKWSRRHQATVLTATALTVAFLLLAVGLLWLGYSRIRRERDAKDVALAKAEDSARAAKESARDARQAVDRYYTTVSESTLFDTPAMQPLRRKLLEDALGYYQRFLQEHGDDPGLEAELATTHFRVWQINLAVDRFPAAMASLRGGLDLAEKLYRQHPEDPELFKKLASFRKGGSWLHRNYEFSLDPREDVRTLERAAGFWEALARQHPGIAEFRLSLAQTYADLAYIVWFGAPPGKELAVYQKAYGIYEKLALENANSLEYQEHLARAHLWLSYYLNDARRFQEAENVANKGLYFAEAMTAQFPGVHCYRECLAEAYSRLTEVYADSRQDEKAEKAFRQAADLLERLAADVPNSPAYPAALALLERKRFYMLLGAGHLREAEKAARHEVAIYENLLAQFPGGGAYDNFLGGAFWQLASVLNAAGRGPEAVDALRRSVLLREQAKSRYPTDWQQYGPWLTSRYVELVGALQASGKSAEAQDVARQARRFYEKLATSYPTGPDHRHHRGMAQLALAQVFRSANMQADAEGAFRQALALHEGLVAEYPDEASYRQGLARACVELAAFLRMKQPAEAVQVLRQALAVHEKLVAEFPREAQYGYELFVAYDLLAQMGNIKEAERGWRKLLALDPTNGRARNRLAWRLATCPDPKLRNGSWAVELARKAVGLEPEQGSWWNTLGAAQYRAGDWKAAIDALTKAMELRLGGDPWDWFFLAMAHWRLGHKEEARRWYDQSVAGMQKNFPHHEELRRFRAEAEELLEIKKK